MFSSTGCLFPIISWHLFFQAIDLGRFPFVSRMTAHGLGCVSGAEAVICLGHNGAKTRCDRAPVQPTATPSMYSISN